MADANDFKPGDNTNVLLRKILARLSGLSGGGSGGTVTLNPGDVEIGAVELKNATDDTRSAVLGAAPGAGDNGLVVRNIPSGTQTVTGPLTDTQLRASAVPVSGPVTDTQLRASAVPVSGPVTDTQLRASAVPVSGPVTDTQLRASAVPVSAASLPLPAGAATEATLAAFSAAALADNAGFTDGTSKVLPAGFIFDDVAGTALTENDVAAARIDSKRAQVFVIEDATTRGRKATVSAGGAVLVDASATTQPISGNIGGKTASIKDTTAVSTSPAYTAGDAVGGKRTLANALTAVGTGVLESIHLMDRANQSLGLTIYIFDADPSGATITDNAAFVFSTDDLKVLAIINVATTDWTVSNSKAMCSKANLGIVLKSAGTSLYAAIVCTSTPTFAATTDLQVIFGILQD